MGRLRLQGHLTSTLLSARRSVKPLHLGANFGGKLGIGLSPTNLGRVLVPAEVYGQADVSFLNSVRPLGAARSITSPSNQTAQSGRFYSDRLSLTIRLASNRSANAATAMISQFLCPEMKPMTKADVGCNFSSHCPMMR